MSEREPDIEFDFFDEPATEEATQRRTLRRPGGGPPRTPRRPIRPSPGLTPLLRLVGLIAGAILIIVLLAFWVQSCQGASKRNRYQTYTEKVSAIAKDSQSTGRQVAELLTTPGERESDLESKLSRFGQQESQYVNQAQDISPPGPLRSAHQHVIEALQFRASGLNGLADALRQTRRSKDPNATGNLLAAQAQRLIASDVVWDDLFKDPTREELRRQGITGVNVPDSNFLENSDLATARSLAQIVKRVRSVGTTATGTSGGLHGTGLVSTKVVPTGTQLSTSTTNTITSSTELAFQVTVQDTGNSQEVRIPVKLTIPKTPNPIVKTGIIDVINPGETKVVTFANIGQPPFGVKTEVKVTVEPVKGESNLTNNSATYPAIFSIG
jgi:virulence-associated protein VagC